MCPSCAGAWLDNVRSERLARGILGAPFEQATLRAEASALRSAASGYRAPARAMEATRVCAECEAPLRGGAVKNTDIVVDGCSRHGPFFDPGELIALSYHFREKAARDAIEVREFEETIERTREAHMRGSAGLYDLAVDLVTWLARSFKARER